MKNTAQLAPDSPNAMPSLTSTPLATAAAAPAVSFDYDFEEWYTKQTFPVELAPARLARLKPWFTGHGFRVVEIKYVYEADRFRLTMYPGVAVACQNDEQVEVWLRRAADECNVLPTELIGLRTQDGTIVGSFRGGVPR